MHINNDKKISLKQWVRSGDPFIWINAAAVSISVVAVVGLLLLLTVRGFGHFWPADVMEAKYTLPNSEGYTVAGELVETESVPLEQLLSAGFEIDSGAAFIDRMLLKQGNRDVNGADFAWVIDDYLSEKRYPSQLMTIERREWGNFYGYLQTIKQNDAVMSSADLWMDFQQRIERALLLYAKIEEIEKGNVGSINYQLERLRLSERGLALDDNVSSAARAVKMLEIESERTQYQQVYSSLQKDLASLYQQIGRDSFIAVTMDGTAVEIKFAAVVRAYQANAMGVAQKSLLYLEKFWEFLSDEPREANTEGGIFPAIFGTVMMVILMSIMVTPFGVVAAVYLREYAKQGLMTRIVRIAVNNLAGVPSIVYGVFGLGFFIYFLGSEIDEVLFSAALPAPTFGTPGLLWASLTLALLTLPVVIVATEEGLSRIPKALREGSLALGATKAETLWRVVIPMASPAMMTGLILAVARAAGEVAPLMLVGVVKLAPSLPVNGDYPYIHLDQKFMHLGFHIYDVGFQSPNVEAARPLVYATALLLVVIIALLNFSAVALRNRLREKYKALDM
ncbi:phosphate ABC transporter, permease protein PtsA [marine gamma proteobacterium HTCC2143]|uniref:Phosphate transport system permease protein PstA n=1 Tax=marine gamma proteobacterium HTCC2143 TaxID=247633 RepID=A0YCC7_9GAMM|nr:phosphate ABC transporter, permease protein PtsA [marine gamma proteobacterium HTCC2143]